MARTPFMEQYLQIKAQYQDYILLFRLGDFYEMFNEDAKLVSRELGLTLTGRDCEEHGGGRKRDSIVSDAMESVIAASYMDGGFSAAKEIIDRLILCDVPAGKPHNFDYKTALQELVQRKKDQVLRYELIGESGPDHDKKFDVEVLLNGKPCGKGTGSSKKRAEQAAAAAAIDALFPGEL